MEKEKQEGVTLVVDESVTPVYAIPARIQAVEIKAYCSGLCGKAEDLSIEEANIGPLTLCYEHECKFLDGQMLESCGVLPNGNPVFLRKLVEFVGESNDAADSLAYDLHGIHHKELHEKFKNGDWVTGIDKHKGCSKVFTDGSGDFQPFFWLDDYNPDHYRLSTTEEVDEIKSQGWYKDA